jgi:hypothetical protein
MGNPAEKRTATRIKSLFYFNAPIHVNELPASKMTRVKLTLLVVKSLSVWTIKLKVVSAFGASAGSTARALNG